MTHVVIGAGEVGRAIAEVLATRYAVVLRDLVDTGERPEWAVLHVAFPWSPTFEDDVCGYIDRYSPHLVVIHSTVPVGTSRRLSAVHSPVTGRHPNLAPSLRTFVKFFGGDRAGEASAMFAACGVPTRAVADQETTEAGKLWATLQYGWVIALQKEAYRFAREHGADPDIAYREFNEAYNAGYAALDEPYRLPVLDDMPGPIGGHCVIPNARITDSAIAAILVGLDATW